MKTSFLIKPFFLGFLAFSALVSTGYCAQPSSALLKAKQEAEARGYIFETSHADIVAKAKKEGRFKGLTGLEPEVFPHMLNSFREKYPFIKAELQEITGPDAAQRFTMELKAGTVRDWDTTGASTDFYDQYPPFAKKFDILGMAEHGILKISPKLVDPKYRNIVSLTTGISVPVYNKNLISADKAPDKWEDFLKPEYKGKKFMVDIRPHIFAAFPACPEAGMGFEWAMKLARGLRDQDPIWIRGNTRAISAITTGEYALHFGVHYQSATRAMRRDRTGALQLKIIEPVPVRMGNLDLVLNSAPNPYAALLLLEHYASAVGQEIIDKYYPAIASVHTPGSHLSKLLQGKRLCINGFDTFHNSDEWMAKAVEAMGFPKAERTR